MRDVAREAHLVRRDQHRHPAGGELADHVEHLRDELGVERARDLVEEQQPRLHRERAHDRDALLLAAGEPVGVLVALVGEPEAREQRVGLAAACLRQAARLPRPSVTFSSTLMCGKRLNDWKTIPISRRTRLTSTPRRGDLLAAATTIRPASIGSSRFTQRSSVDLPDPEAPIRHTTSCSASVEVDPAEHLELAERLVEALERPPSAGVAAHASLPGLLAPPVARDEPVGEARERDRDRDEQRRRDEVVRAVEGRRLVDLRLPEAPRRCRAR